jgi:type I restriction enzyme M protein
MAVIGLPPNLFYSTTIPTCILIFRALGTKIEQRQNGVLFIDASERSVKGKNRNVLTETDIADLVTLYHSKFDSDGKSVDGHDGSAARFVSTTEIASNAYDLNVGRYIKRATTSQADLPSLIEAYNLARAERQKVEQNMLTVLADAGIEDFNE